MPETTTNVVGNPIKEQNMTQKELRKAARKTLAKSFNGESVTPDQLNAAIQVLHAPDRKGE